MRLHSVKGFTAFVRRLTAVSVVEQWDSHVAKVGGKVFALIGQDGGYIVFKVGELSFEGLSGLEGVEQARYFAKRHWVSVGRGAALRDAELEAYIEASHGLVARKLTRRLRAELGLSVE